MQSSIRNGLRCGGDPDNRGKTPGIRQNDRIKSRQPK